MGIYDDKNVRLNQDGIDIIEKERDKYEILAEFEQYSLEEVQEIKELVKAYMPELYVGV